MKHLALLLLCSLTTVFTVFDLGFTTFVREPYPSFVMPSFATSETRGDSVSSLFYEVVINDSLAKPIQEYFPELRKLSLASSVRFAFFNESKRKGTVSGSEKLKSEKTAGVRKFFDVFYEERDSNMAQNMKKLKNRIEHHELIVVKKLAVCEYELVESIKTNQVLKKRLVRKSPFLEEVSAN